MNDPLAGFKEDIEDELGNEDINSTVPFDPNDINLSIVPRTIGQLVDMIEFNEISTPSYQRLPNLWSLKMKSRFIESLMLDLPIPLFYFDEESKKSWKVIDGLQRISTLEHFILAGTKSKSISGNLAPFKLVDLEFRTEYNGKGWNELPKDLQRRIATNQVTINLIGKGTPDEVKYNIFSRINLGGIPLAAQEIRTALFQGYRLEFLEDLVSPDTEEGKAFLKVTGNSIPRRRQQDLDFATRFISFYLIDYDKYEPDMDTFLTKGTRLIPESNHIQKRIKDDFKTGIELAGDLFGRNAFRKTRTGSDRRGPINKPLFEIISVNFAKCNKEQRDNLLLQREYFLQEFQKLLEGDKFGAAITTGTAAKDRVKQRHEDFNNLLDLISLL